MCTYTIKLKIFIYLQNRSVKIKIKIKILNKIFYQISVKHSVISIWMLFLEHYVQERTQNYLLLIKIYNYINTVYESLNARRKDKQLDIFGKNWNIYYIKNKFRSGGGWTSLLYTRANMIMLIYTLKSIIINSIITLCSKYNIWLKIQFSQRNWRNSNDGPVSQFLVKKSFCQIQG